MRTQIALGMHFAWKNQVRTALAASKPVPTLALDTWLQWLTTEAASNASPALCAALTQALQNTALAAATAEKHCLMPLERSCRRMEVLLYAWEVA